MSSSDAGSGDIDESTLPTAEACSALIDQFVFMTNTNSALAQSLLQGLSWDLTRAINRYFTAVEYVESEGEDEHKSNEGKPKPLEVKAKEVASDEMKTQEVKVAVLKASAVKTDTLSTGVDPGAKSVLEVPPEYEGFVITTEPPRTIRFITWNLDGLDPVSLVARTKHACAAVKHHHIDIVFFQEVTPESYRIMKEELPEYRFCISGRVGYFNATLLRVFTVYYDSYQVVPFKTTMMERTLLVVKAHIGKHHLVLMNTHLESTAKHASARVAQLKEAFGKLLATDKTLPVIFAGDMNLRDRELTMSGGIPEGVLDAWIACGSRADKEFTWDLRYNTNHEMPCRFQPRLRFDRVYIRPAEMCGLVPTYFGLIGLQKVPQTQRFASDHWGVRVDFTLGPPDQVTESQ